jgi:hypothetical protein
MPIAIGDQVYEDEVHYNASLLGIELPKEDTPFTSSSTTTSTTPLKPTTLPADALKSNGGTKVPENSSSNPEALPDINDIPHHDWIESTIKAIPQALALPGDILSGKVKAGTPQEIERAADLAGLMVFGPAPVASKLADGTLGSFAGVKSKTVDLNKLAEAQVMKANGASADDVWKQTGFYKAADGRWKYEISDNSAKLKMENFVDETPKETFGWDSANTNTAPVIRPKNPLNDIPPDMSVQDQVNHLMNAQVHQPLSEIIDHPELFKAYPFLKDVRVQNMPESMRSRALAFVDTSGTIHMSPMSPDLTKEILLHEVQHVIQRHEGFARGGDAKTFEHPNLPKAQKLYDDAIAAGGNPNSPALVKAKKIIDDNKEQAYQSYLRLAGEVESRNVESRLLLNELQQKNLSPSITEEFAPNEQIVKFRDGVSNSEIKPGQLPEGYFDKVPIDRRLSRSGTEPSHPGFRWEVYDPKTNKVMRKDIMTRSGASRTQDNLDNKYGAYRYRVRMVKAKELTENERQFLTDNNINIGD